MIIDFPYQNVKSLDIPDSYNPDILCLPDYDRSGSEEEVVRNALSHPIGSPALREIADGKTNVLIVVDDITRPTPVYRFISLVLNELEAAGVRGEHISFMVALGTHRFMTRDEMIAKLGIEIVDNYPVYNHDWKDHGNLEYIGDTEQGAPVWINRKVKTADLVIGIGSIMPIEICGFTGGGKILIPGLSGEKTVDEMHWTRIDVPSESVIGIRDNPIRVSIDALAGKAGLDFIVNVITDATNTIVAAVAGDMIEAHRAGCETALDVFGVKVEKEYDIVIADSYPFDNEFWQANKALDTAGGIVQKNGVIILVTPCEEGLSITHEHEIKEFGYRTHRKIKELVREKAVRKVVGVHMYQVSAAVVEKAQLIIVSPGISKQDAERVGFRWAGDVQEAFECALTVTDASPDIVVLKNSPKMLIRKELHNE